MDLKTTITATVRTTIPIPFVSVSTFGTFLTGISRVNRNNLFTQSFRFVADKLFKLIETPVVEFPVKVLSSAFINSDAGQIFKGNHIKGHIDNFFCNTMVNISHKPSFLSANLLEKTFSRFGAFGLEFFPQICVLGSCVLDLFAVKKDIVGTYCDIDNTSVDTNNSITGWLRRFRSDYHMQIKNIISDVISKCGTSGFPINILFVVFGNTERYLNPSIYGCNSGKPVFKNNTDNSLVIPDCRIWSALWKSLELNTFESFASHIPCTLNKRRWEFRMSSSNVFVSSIMDRYLRMCTFFKPVFSNFVEYLIEKYNCLHEAFFVFIRQLKFQFKGSIHIHILNTILKITNVKRGEKRGEGSFPPTTLCTPR